VKTIKGEARVAPAQGGRVVEGDPYLVYEENYDERGNKTLVAISDNSPGPVGVVYRRLVYIPDAQGRLSRYESYPHGWTQPHDVIVYSYDERGNRVRVETTRTGTSIHAVQEFSHDAEGRVTEHSFSTAADGWKRHRSVQSYEGNLIHSGAVSEAGVQTARGTILTDERGNPLSVEHYRIDARGEEHLIRKVTYEYDRRGFLTEVRYHKAEEWLKARAVYEYSERGDLTRLTRYNADGSFAGSEHREYVYDAAGNWVKRVTSLRASEGGPLVPQRVERRSIKYY
jgi:hypothetical protein